VLEVVGIHKAYEGQPLLRGVSFSVAPAETVCLLGASGSGKSTLLRIICGLEPADSGSILWDGADLASTPPHQRDFGLVFQDYALFPHLNVFENVAFGLKMRNWPPDRIKQRTAEVLEIVNMETFAQRAVTDLSGGEQQRVALARALAPRPRLLMFDEPLGALDRTLRESLLEELRSILHQTRVPAIYVTHDQDEALKISDRVLLLHQGELVRAGSPAEVWSNPGTAWAADFLGLGKILPGTALGQKRFETPIGVFEVECAHSHQPGEKVHLLVRPAGVREGTGGNALRAPVADVIFEQDRFKVMLGNGLYFYINAAPAVGENISVRIAPECLG